MGTAPEASAPVGLEPEEVLVGHVREFLRRRSHDLAPDALLTQAWDRFYRTYARVLRRMATEFRLDREETEDVIQEVWARIIGHFAQFEQQVGSSGFRGWLYTLIRNRALDLIRWKARHPIWRLARTSEQREPIDPGPGPADEGEARGDCELVHLLLAHLQKKVSATNYRLLHMRWLEGRPVADVAFSLNLSQRQVVYRQQRVLRKLRATLAEFRGKLIGKESRPQAY
jgi:RNA polymerase sigma-70 factor (ECF subfamily)